MSDELTDVQRTVLFKLTRNDSATITEIHPHKRCELLTAPDPSAPICAEVATWELLVHCDCGREGYVYVCDDHRGGAEDRAGSHPPCTGRVVLVATMPLTL